LRLEWNMSTTISAPQPLGTFIKMGADGNPFLEGVRCGNCGEVQLESRRACPKCAAIGSLAPARLAQTGKLFSYTIVYRSFPGIATPFISAVVELDGGGFLKGNLTGVEPKPEALRFDMPVRVQFDHPKVSGKPGLDVLRYVFVPLGGDHG
jgi:uncharacterized OB-fold protein